MADYSISTVITADSSNFDKNIKKAGKSLDGFSSNIKSVTKLLGGLFAITSITALAKSIKDVSEEFSKATANISKGTGATGKALQNLSKSVNNAMRMGVGRSASEVGSMIADLNTRFGVTDETLERMVDRFDMFATVTDTDVKTSINGVADLMAKWNVSLEDSDKLLDQLTVASQMSGASVTELSAGLKTGQSVLSQFGMSLTESTAFLASLSKNGVSTGVALTGLRTALANFSADGKEAGSAFKEVSDRIKNAKTQTEALQIATETFGTRSGAEMVKVLQASSTSTEEFTQALRNAGGALAETDRASRTSQDALDDLKATIQATFFSSGADTGLRDMIDGIAEAFRKINFAELKEQFSSIGLFLRGVWEQFKELFNNIKEAIDISGTNFGSWKEVIYNHLNAVYRVLQDWVGGFSALLKGDFSLAWDYAKLAVMRTADYMLDTLSKLANSMPELINKIIDGLNAGIEKLNEGLALIGKDPIELIGHVDNVDLSDALGLDDAIEELEKKIEQATGKVADKTLQDLKKVSNNVKSTTKEINTHIGELGQSAKEAGDKAGKGAEVSRSAWYQLGEQIKADAEDWSDVTSTITDGLKSVAVDGIEGLGASLVEGESAWEDYGATALNMLAQVLEAIGAQLTAMATAYALAGDYAHSAMAGAGAVALYASAGVIKATAKSMKSMDTTTKNISNNLSDSVETLAEFQERWQELLSGVSTVTSEFKVIGQLKTEIRDLTVEYNLARDKIIALGNIPFLDSSIDLREFEKAYKAMTTAKEKLEVAQAKLNSAFSNYYTQLGATNAELSALIQNYKDLYNRESQASWGITYMTQANELKNSLLNTMEEIMTIGSSIGENLIDSITEGASSTDFMSDMKKIIRNYLIKTKVYSDDMIDKLSRVGNKIQDVMFGSSGDWSEVVTDLQQIYRIAESYVRGIDLGLDKAFGKTADELEEELTSIEQMIKDFTESISDLGGDIANSLIDGISNGLSQSDFLENMYEWIRKLIVQTVVYTESMKSEIEAIGKAISDGLSKGFTSDSLHEIRRDLSYIFFSASKQMEGIDSVLEGVFSGYASGTDNASRGLHLVGEAGPELVAFHGGEKVYNADETSRMMNGGNNFNVTFNNMQDTSAYAMMSEMKQWQREMAFNAVI